MVFPDILEIYQNLLGARFHEVKDTQTRHPDVQMFAVWVAVAQDESDFVGCCYIDLFPRGVLPCLFILIDVHITDLTTSLESKYG